MLPPYRHPNTNPPPSRIKRYTYTTSPPPKPSIHTHTYTYIHTYASHTAYPQTHTHTHTHKPVSKHQPASPSPRKDVPVRTCTGTEYAMQPSLVPKAKQSKVPTHTYPS
ncbi:hypothetical protein BO70DRAFT_364241 [Aspergillus heteromorphus CBS 117.55]|uniref:Uncharacterized protein n=1 Tax=Aspergillus heteromorphus CBS 117.55 TaxID=1448321 RepID=A0A317VLC2_9EURO|nr:uncharacterized protein BO70DRAFT_364241 [Aspergillus heteromorphus CBS 117.55]PWY75163.1 hypothetical protein BO70DRAFT_364241 [Aspergillus heteromorphus CBS 117.55]